MLIGDIFIIWLLIEGILTGGILIGEVVTEGMLIGEILIGIAMNLNFYNLLFTRDSEEKKEGKVAWVTMDLWYEAILYVFNNSSLVSICVIFGFLHFDPIVFSRAHEASKEVLEIVASRYVFNGSDCIIALR